VTQEEYFGVGSIQNLPEVLKKTGKKKVFLLTGKNSYQISGAEKIIGEILKEYDVTVFREFTENPKLEDVETGIRAIKASACEIVIAVGGGGVIDVAKAVNILAAQIENPQSIVEGTAKIVEKGLPLIAVPTTAGAGSEATHFAVVYMGKNKYSLAHPHILPDIVIVDPQFTFNLSPKITATSGMDVLCQSVESYWSVGSSAQSRAYSAEAIKLVLGNLVGAVNNPSHANRVGMSKAANLAGKAINITKTTAPHAISYSLTSYFGVPHGQAVSVSLGAFLEYNHDVTDKDVVGTRSADATKALIDEIIKLFDCSGPREAREKIGEIMSSIGLKTTLSELGVRTAEELNIISSNVNPERLLNNPRVVTRESLEALLKGIL
jgi:alcohol dehydrogenase class IV